MAKGVLKNVRLFAAGLDLTGVSNKIDWNADAGEEETTTFGDYDPAGDKIWRTVEAGMASFKVQASGNIEVGPGQVDEALVNGLGIKGTWSAWPNSQAPVGSLVYFANALEGQIKILGELGKVAPWSGSWAGSSPMVRGLGLHPPGTARTATGDGTSVQHVAVPAGRQLYAGLQVLSVAGTSTPTLTAKVQSDDGTGFASPTDRILFDAATAAGSQFKTVAGANTDTWYRVVWTISGTTPSFLFLAKVGVA